MLHAILDRPEEGLRVSVVASFELLGNSDHRREELLIDVFVHVDTLNIHADLPAMYKCKESDLCRNYQHPVQSGIKTMLAEESHTLATTASISTSSQMMAASLPPCRPSRG